MADTGTKYNNRRKTYLVTEGRDGQSGSGPIEYFHETVTITSAAAATAVNIIPDARVGAGRKVYLQGYISRVNGATNWATTASIKIQDTNSSAVDFVTIAVNAGTTNGNIRTVPGNANVTLENAFANGTGGTEAKGLQLKGDANGTGSDLLVTVWGVIN